MQKSEFADHSVPKCQFQSVLFVNRLKITRNPLEIAGDGDLMTQEEVFFSKLPFKAHPSNNTWPVCAAPSGIQMNQIIIIQMKEQDFLPVKCR